MRNRVVRGAFGNFCASWSFLPFLARGIAGVSLIVAFRVTQRWSGENLSPVRLRAVLIVGALTRAYYTYNARRERVSVYTYQQRGCSKWTRHWRPWPFLGFGYISIGAAPECKEKHRFLHVVFIDSPYPVGEVNKLSKGRQRIHFSKAASQRILDLTRRSVARRILHDLLRGFS